MSKIYMKQQVKRKTAEEIVQILAEKYNKSTRLIQMVINGQVRNDDILTDYLTYKQEYNKLLKAVKEAVSF